MLKQIDAYKWQIEPFGNMLVPAVIFADEQLLTAMDQKAFEQITNVAALPGIVKAAYAMPDAHWGYGFPIGGVAAFDPDTGVVSAGGVGFDISCGVRTLITSLTAEQIEAKKDIIAEVLAHKIPAGVGSTSKFKLTHKEMDDVLTGGAAWAIDKGWGQKEDLERIEERGAIRGADPKHVSDQAKQRQLDEVGTLGSGNHYLEIQRIDEIYDEKAAQAFGLRLGYVVLSIHCGSRGLGHQIGTDYLKKMVIAAPTFGITLPERELACAPIRSPLGSQYISAMRCGINCALANRQTLTHLVRHAFSTVIPNAEIKILYDVSHNTCKEEAHKINGKTKDLFVHRKGATRSFGPGDPTLPSDLRPIGQPVIIGGTMGTSSFILAGTTQSLSQAFGSSCHGAGRSMSRNQATSHFNGRDVVKTLAARGIIIKSPSMKGVAEEAPDAYKDVEAVVNAAHNAGLSRKVARLTPMICVKG